MTTNRGLTVKARTRNLLLVSVLFDLDSLLTNNTTRFKSLSPLGGLGERLAPCGLILWDVLLVNIWLQVQRSALVPTLVPSPLKRMVAQFIHLVRVQTVKPLVKNSSWYLLYCVRCIVHQICICVKFSGFACYAWNASFSLQGTRNIGC